MGIISENVYSVLAELPRGVELVAAAKTRTPKEINEAIDAGLSTIGENYIQEAEAARATIGAIVNWHFIGSLQNNKVKKAVRLFDLIETVDSVALARAIGNEGLAQGKIMPVFIEINSGREPQKTGVMPENAQDIVRQISDIKGVKILGLMTMGPRTGNPEEARPYFVETRKIFEQLQKLDIARVEMKYLSMGMTNSYKIAIEEGANMIRLGSRIFGHRT